MTRRLLALVGVLTVAAAAGWWLLPNGEPAGSTAPVDVGRGLLALPTTASAWVDAHPDSPIANDVTRRIAEQPQAFWLVGNEGDRALPEIVDSALAQDRTMQLVLYNIPGRDDGLSGKQGTRDLAAYRTWIDRVSDQIGDARALVVVEPDALWFVDRQTPRGEARRTRMAALRYAVETLDERNPNVHTYLEAGTTSKSVTPQRMAALLLEAGADDDTGFAVNVSSFAPDADLTRYASVIRRTLQDGGIADPRWVVDTSRNGNPEWDFTWCNPPDREIGVEPGVVDGPNGRDANLWIKGPATSDGDCGIGTGTVGGEFLADDAARQLR